MKSLLQGDSRSPDHTRPSGKSPGPPKDVPVRDHGRAAAALVRGNPGRWVGLQAEFMGCCGSSPVALPGSSGLRDVVV